MQLGLFDERNLFEFSHPDFPSERLVACRNAELGRLRAHKREALLAATEQELKKVQTRIENGSLAGRDKIGVRVGKVLNKYKVGKHFALSIEESGFRSSAWISRSLRKPLSMASMSSARACRKNDELR